MAMLGKHLERRELPALDVNDEDDEGDNGVASTGSNESSEDGEDSKLGKGTKQHALIVFGGRDEDDQRLDTLYALSVSTTSSGAKLNSNSRINATTWSLRGRLRCR